MEEEFYNLIGSEADGFEAAADRYAELIERNPLANVSRKDLANNVLDLRSEDIRIARRQMDQLKSDVRAIRKKINGPEGSEGE